MDDLPPTPPSERLRLTTGTLMVWVAVVAVAMAVVQGDVADWLPSGAIGWLGAVIMLATAVGIPWLEYHWGRSPDSLRPPSASARRAVNLLVLTLLACMACAVVLLGVLVAMILGRT
jgi:hypothetical protein